MLASAHAFLRGSAPLFYELLRERPDLLPSLAGDGIIVGDMHLENVGAYRADDDEVVFGLNDFDDAAQGPWALDILRLAASAFLASRSFGADGPLLVGLVEGLAHAHARSAGGAARALPVPAVVQELLERAARRTGAELLDERAPRLRGRRRISRGERYIELPARVRRAAPGLVASYLSDRPGGFRIEDCAQRIAGTGSLGVVRVAVLLSLEDGRERLLDFKEARPSAVAALVRQPPGDDAERMVRAARALSERPPKRLRAVRVAPLGLSFVGRRFTPQEDKLDLARLHPGHRLDELFAFVGQLLGRAHRRAARTPPRRSWSDREIRALVGAAAELAAEVLGVHLAYALRLGGGPG